MSNQQQPPRSQFLTMMLMFTCIYLGSLMVCQPGRNADTRTSTEVLNQLKTYNSQLLDVKAAELLPAYLRKIQEEKGAQKWDADRVEQKEIEGIVLVADAKYRGAKWRFSDPADKSLVHKKLNDGWLLLQQRFDHVRNKPVWQAPVETGEGPVTPGTLYDTMMADLSVRNKSELVWGIFPGFSMIDALVAVTGKVPSFSYWFAAFLLALVVRVIVYPWSKKQYALSRQMSQLGPLVKEIQEKYKPKGGGPVAPEKQAQLSAETMALYKEYGVNPFAMFKSGLIQFPIFMIVFACMQLYRFEFVKGSFAWIHLGATKLLGVDVAPNLGQTDNILVILYGLSMIASQLMMPVTDPSQVKMQRIMGVGITAFITFIMFMNPLPAAFTLYWVFANFLATAQALYAYRQPAPPLEKVQTVKGGVAAKPGFLERLQQMAAEQAQTQNGAPAKNGKGPNRPEMPTDPSFFGKTGSPRKKK